MNSVHRTNRPARKGNVRAGRARGQPETSTTNVVEADLPL